MQFSKHLIIKHWTYTNKRTIKKA